MRACIKTCAHHAWSRAQIPCGMACVRERVRVSKRAALCCMYMESTCAGGARRGSAGGMPHVPLPPVLCPSSTGAEGAAQRGRGLTLWLAEPARGCNTRLLCQPACQAAGCPGACADWAAMTLVGRAPACAPPERRCSACRPTGAHGATAVVQGQSAQRLAQAQPSRAATCLQHVLELHQQRDDALYQVLLHHCAHKLALRQQHTRARRSHQCGFTVSPGRINCLGVPRGGARLNRGARF